jgi:hypothetical protein
MCMVDPSVDFASIYFTDSHVTYILTLWPSLRWSSLVFPNGNLSTSICFRETQPHLNQNCIIEHAGGMRVLPSKEEFP